MLKVPLFCGEIGDPSANHCDLHSDSDSHPEWLFRMGPPLARWVHFRPGQRAYTGGAAGACDV